MPHLTLFYAPGTCALAIRIALNEAGADYQLQYVDFAQGAQRSAEYLALNPLGRVPALRVEDGTVLTEAVALLPYIAQRFASAHLAPSDPVQFARMQSFHGYLASTVHVAHAHRKRGSRWADDEHAIAAMQAKVASNMADCFVLIEEHWLGHGPWVMGEQYTVADGYLFTISSWLAGDGVDMAHFPRVAEHYQRMLQRPAVRAAVHD